MVTVTRPSEGTCDRMTSMTAALEMGMTPGVLSATTAEQDRTSQTHTSIPGHDNTHRQAAMRDLLTVGVKGPSASRRSATKGSRRTGHRTAPASTRIVHASPPRRCAGPPWSASHARVGRGPPRSAPRSATPAAIGFGVAADTFGLHPSSRRGGCEPRPPAAHEPLGLLSPKPPPPSEVLRTSP